MQDKKGKVESSQNAGALPGLREHLETCGERGRGAAPNTSKHLGQRY